MRDKIFLGNFGISMLFPVQELHLQHTGFWGLVTSNITRKAVPSSVQSYSGLCEKGLCKSSGGFKPEIGGAHLDSFLQLKGLWFQDN